MGFEQNQEPEKPKRGEMITGVPDPGYAAGPPDDWDHDYDSPRKKKKHGDPLPPPRTSRGCGGCAAIGGVSCLVILCLCCILPCCLVVTVGGGIAAVASDSEAMFNAPPQTFNVDGDNPVRLTVDNPVGAVSVQRGSSRDTVEITYTLRAYGWNNDRAQRELHNIQVNIQQPEPNDIRVSVDTHRDSNNFFAVANNADITIRVPESVYLVINNNLGAIEVRDVRAESLDLTCSVGGIVFDGALSSTSGETFRAEVSTGGIEFRLPRGVYVEVDARTGVGDVSVDEDQFMQVSDVSRYDSGPEISWRGIIGRGDADPPLLELHTNTGGISVEAQ